MQVYWILVRRELGGYFASLAGYILMATVLLLLGLSFTQMLGQLNVEASEAPLTELFFITFYFWVILLLTAPVITIRTFALEKFSGTFETLMTAPVSDLQVVLAKFSGAFLFYALTWLPLLGYLLVVREYSNDPMALDLRVLGTTFLGLLLIGALYMAMGCFASSLTQSQIIAAMISYAFGLTLFLLSLRAMGATLPGWQGELLGQISMIEHMEAFALGIIDTRYLAFYLSFTGFFLFLTLKVVESRRWK